MAHDFYCGNCGRWVANCGMSDDHTKVFSFSTTCACGNRVSDSCGGRRAAPKSTQGKTSFFQIRCTECGTAYAHVSAKTKKDIKIIDASCPKCKAEGTSISPLL